MRGGTSKGPVLKLDDVPPEGRRRDSFLIDLMGSRDAGQLDGLGGGTSTTSKVMLVRRSTIADHDIEYLFAQVDPRRPVVDYGGNCGNMTSAVGLYAILEGIVAPTDPVTVVRMFNLNTARSVVAYVPSDETGPLSAGDFQMSGLSVPGAAIVNEYLNPEGSVFQHALPTGEPLETLTLPDGREIEVSIVDAASPAVFLRAADVGLSGTETPPQIDGNTGLLELLETVRGCVAERLGLVDSFRESQMVSPGIPKIAMVARPRDYQTTQGSTVSAADIDVLARIMSVQKAHPAYSITGLICTAVAASISGTIPHEVAPLGDASYLRLGHPKGVAEAELIRPDSENPDTRVRVRRTARRLLHGFIEFPDSLTL